jgi:hypothetical protein
MVDALRDREHARRTLDPGYRRLYEGSLEDQADARREWFRNAYAAKVMNAGWREIPRDDLAFGPFGRVEEVSSGGFFRVFGGDPDYADGVTAFYCGFDGTPVMLTPISGGVGNRAELEQIRAEREARRNAPKPRPAWMR